MRVMLCVPVWNGDKVSHLSVPLGYRMWQKKESKLELAASMIRQVMPEFHSKDHVIIPCDSWYTKQNLVSIVDEYPNPDLIGNARSDSVMYDLTYVYFFVCKISCFCFSYGRSKSSAVFLSGLRIKVSPISTAFT